MMQTASTPSYTLPGALAPYSDESLIGLVVRTAHLHRFHDPMRLFRRIRRLHPTALAAFCQQNPDSKEGQAVRNLLGLDDAIWRRISMWTGDDTTLAIQGWPVRRELVLRSTHAVCPLCLQQAAYHRSAWLINVFPVCVTHGVWLHDVCSNPICKRPLSWSGTGIHRCGNRRCHYDLRHAPTECCDRSVLGGISALSRILQCTDASEAPLGMPPGDAIRMALVLGKMAAGLERTGRAPGFIRTELNRIPAIIDAGWNVLDDWPRGFYGLLELQRTRATERAGKNGLRKAFGSLSKRVYNWAREPWGTPVGAAFAEYAAGCPDLATTSHTLRRYAPGSEIRHLHISLKEAQRVLGVAPSVMQAIAERRNMYVLPPQGVGTPALLRADTVRKLQDEMAEGLLCREARDVLGIGHRVFTQLEADGLIRQMPEGERLMPSRLYRRSELEAFVAACVGKAPKMSAAAAREAGVTSLMWASAPGRSVSDICRALMSGKLRPAATVTDAKGLMKIRVDMSDLEVRLPSSRETLSMVAAALRIGTHYSQLHVWTRRGFLETHASPRRGERGLRLTDEAVERFRRDYVHGGELPALFEQSRNMSLPRQLAFQGVKPVSGPGVDEATLTLFRRVDITPEVIRAVHKVQARSPGTAQDKHRQAFARGLSVAEVVADTWNATFSRTNNRFTDPTTGRILQVIVGRRPSLTGTFRFMVRSASFLRLQSCVTAWVALVPTVGDTFILAPFRDVAWRGLDTDAVHVTLRFNRDGAPLDMTEWSMPMPDRRADPCAVVDARPVAGTDRKRLSLDATKAGRS